MIRHCNSEDVVATVFGREPCGRTYDDVDHSTVCPHEALGGLGPIAGVDHKPRPDATPRENRPTATPQPNRPEETL